MVPYDFLKLLPHLICHALQSTAVLNQLLGPGESKAPAENCIHATHTLTPCPQGEEGKHTGVLTCAHGCQPLGTAVKPAIAKAIHREGEPASKAASHTKWWLQPRRRGKINTWGEGWQATGADRVPPQGMGEGAVLCAGPIPHPTSCLGTDQPRLGANSYLKVMVPKSTNVTFQKQQNGHCYASHLKFPILLPQHKNFFPPNINTSCPLWHCDCPRTSSEYTSLTLQALLQVMHPFVKEAACCWLKGRILEFLFLTASIRWLILTQSLPSVLVTDSRKKSQDRDAYTL
jgi:hypothetical protein